MAPRIIQSVEELKTLVGQEVGVSDWFTITQSLIDSFAEITGDRQWIHCDPERARKESPFGTTIAHGFLTLSLLSTLVRDAIALPPLRLAINYGLNRVRFVSAVPSGARVRARLAPKAIDDVGDALQVTWTVTVEREHGDKPCCVAEWVVRYYPVRAEG